MGVLVKMKFAVIRYIRYGILYRPEGFLDFVQDATKFLVKDAKDKDVKVSYQDYNQLYQALLFLGNELKQSKVGEVPKELLGFLEEIWRSSNESTVVTKLE